MENTSLVFVFVSLMLLQRLLGQTVEEVEICPPYIRCPDLQAQVPFPFTNSTHPDYGLLMINCTQPKAMVQFEENGKWYEVIYIDQFPFQAITYFDPKLQNYLNSMNCDLFNNYSLPSTPFVSYTMSNLTLFKCNSSDGTGSTTKEYFTGYSIYEGCPGIDIYYNYTNGDGEIPETPQECSVVRIPKQWGDDAPKSNNLFELVNASVMLDYQVTSECLDCHSNGGQCDQNTSPRDLNCVGLVKFPTNDHNSKVSIILATVIPGTVLLLVALLIFWHRHRKQEDGSSNVLLRGVFSKRSKSDLEKSAISYGVPVFSYSELVEATNNFDASKELGDGGFGTVYYGKLRDGREVAVKRLYENNYKRVEQFLNEVEILTRLRHPNLVTLYGCTSRHSRELLLVYEFIPNGTVADHLHGDRANGSLTWPIRMSIATETACALAYLHASDIIHRDVKTTNILLDNNFSVKVADFGLSRLFPTDVTHISTAPQGTPGYVDPEYYQCYQLTTKSDVYSFGVVLIELVSSMPAVDISRHRHEINLANLAINRIRNSAVDELIDPLLGFESDSKVRRMTTSVAELAFQCLQHETDMRPTMDEVLRTLERISSDEYAEGESVASGVLKDVQPLASPDCDEVVLLKDRRPPLSPISVTDKWVSAASSMNNFSTQGF